MQKLSIIGLRYKFIRRVSVLAFFCIVSTVATGADTHVEYFAEVDGESITLNELQEAVNRRVRTSMYHSNPSAEQMARVRKEVGAELVKKRQLAKEARRRSIEVDPHSLQNSLKQMESYMKQNNKAYSDQDRIFTREFISREQLIRKLREDVVRVDAPNAGQLKDYYLANPDKFTEPAQHKLSVILLKVAPSASKDVWQAARTEAQTILNDIAVGKFTFIDAARLRSSDPSAEQGGDMGYLHLGMLNAPVEQLISELRVGEISQPFMVLEGIALFKLTDRTPSRLLEFDKVQARAAELYVKEKGEQQWAELSEALEQRSQVHYF